MLAVPYFEKALYELPEDQLTAEHIQVGKRREIKLMCCPLTELCVLLQALADRIEFEVQGGLAGRPLLSVPHIISDEASCCQSHSGTHVTQSPP
jgi:hypothetical protein